MSMPATCRIRLPVAADAPIQFAAEELTRFLAPLGHEVVPASGACELALALDPALPAGGWAITRNGTFIELSGADPAAVRCAAHDLLERLGWRFEVTGPIAPISGTAAWDAVVATTIAPALPRRGIRQHINFPMDISAWPREQALEYVRQLARMRFTHLSIHSYPGQWVVEPGGRQPGGFFYGDVHPLPDIPLLVAASGGQRRWCIPELEGVLDDPVALAKGARAWLAAVISEAARVGLTVQFSFEPRRSDGDIAATIAQAEAILADYPGIHHLELMTQEIDGEGKAADGAELGRKLEALLPGCTARPALSAVLAGTPHDLRSAEQSFGEAAHQILAADGLRRKLAGRVGVSVGYYVVVPRFMPALIELWRHHCDPATGLAILCGHGADRVARRLPLAGIAADEWRRVTIYTWAEIDGYMYQQQEAGAGLQRMLAGLPRGAGAPAVAVNHWRVAECAWQLRYLAEAGIVAGLEPRDFRWQAAVSLGIPQPERVRFALGMIDSIVDTMNDVTPNVGFCHYGCWGEGVGYLGWYKKGLVGNLAAAYGQAREMLAPCAAGAAPGGAAWLRLMDNRLEVSRRYMEAIAIGQEVAFLLNGIKPAQCPPALRPKALALAELAVAEMAAVRALWCQELPDRASVGTAISLNLVTLRVLRRIRHELAGEMPQQAMAAQAGHDAPPSLPG